LVYQSIDAESVIFISCGQSILEWFLFYLVIVLMSVSLVRFACMYETVEWSNERRNSLL